MPINNPDIHFMQKEWAIALAMEGKITIIINLARGIGELASTLEKRIVPALMSDIKYEETEKAPFFKIKAGSAELKLDETIMKDLAKLEHDAKWLLDVLKELKAEDAMEIQLDKNTLTDLLSRQH
jgi:hypothetical protein